MYKHRYVHSFQIHLGKKNTYSKYNLCVFPRKPQLCGSITVHLRIKQNPVLTTYDFFIFTPVCQWGEHRLHLQRPY